MNRRGLFKTLFGGIGAMLGWKFHQKPLLTRAGFRYAIRPGQVYETAIFYVREDPIGWIPQDPYVELLVLPETADQLDLAKTGWKRETWDDHSTG